LEHLCALWDLLGELSAVDQMQSVLAMFKAPLMPAQCDALDAAASQLHLAQLLPTYKDFLLNQLNENTSLGANLSLSAVLSYCTLLPAASAPALVPAATQKQETNDELPELGELAWFRDYFPVDLHLCHAVACFEYLAECHLQQQQ
jgi:hypothetical protein